MARLEGQHTVASTAVPPRPTAAPAPPPVSSGAVADTPARMLVHPADVTVYRDHTGHVVAYEIRFDDVRLDSTWPVRGMETVLDVPPVPVPYPVDAAHPPTDFDG
jgi:hypothetical protein